MTTFLDIAYRQFVEQLAKPGDEIAASLTAERAHLLHMVVGISGEAGELLDAVKKHVIYNKDLDMKNVIEELGDLEFYMQGVRNGLGLTRATILEHNMKKLGARYQEGYSDTAAQARADKRETSLCAKCEIPLDYTANATMDMDVCDDCLAGGVAA